MSTKQDVVHIEFPMFEKKLVCGLSWAQMRNKRHGYTWVTSPEFVSATCGECKRLARKRKIWKD